MANQSTQATTTKKQKSNPPAPLIPDSDPCGRFTQFVTRVWTFRKDLEPHIEIIPFLLLSLALRHVEACIARHRIDSEQLLGVGDVCADIKLIDLQNQKIIVRVTIGDELNTFPSFCEPPFCTNCGCSEGDACPGGCSWFTETLCSNCASGIFLDRKRERDESRKKALAHAAPAAFKESDTSAAVAKQ